jgi:cobalt transporter subunit CbtB
MNTTTATVSTTSSGLMPIVLAVLIGLGVIASTGILQAGALHDAAHDVRHATSFPCH